jgi:hypothetical protein
MNENMFYHFKNKGYIKRCPEALIKHTKKRKKKINFFLIKGNSLHFIDNNNRKDITGRIIIIMSNGVRLK